MRRILVGAMVATVAVTGPASAGTYYGEVQGAPTLQPRTEVHEEVRAMEVHRINPTARVIREDYPSAGADFGFALATTALNLVYTPVRIVYGVVGAWLGGFSGWVSGGDLRTAKGWWRSTTEGDYYIRPAHFDGTTRFRIIGAVPVHPAPETFDEPLPPAAVEPTGDVVPDDSAADETL